jgi:hypothetical protein
MSMILLEPAYKILHTTVKFKRRTISVTPYFGNYEIPRRNSHLFPRGSMLLPLHCFRGCRFAFFVAFLFAG